MKNFIIFVALTILSFNSANSTVYYISSSGNDVNNGTSQSTPWQTISKVNSMMSTFLAGDQILFNRGDTFFGTIIITKSGTAGNEIVIGSYGSGNLPVITGKRIITVWTVHSGNIYKANLSLTDTVSNLYISDQIMTKARFPNTGFLRTDYSGGNTGFYDAALTQASGYWNNADCKIRTINWAYEIRKVSGFSSGNVTFSSPTTYSNYTDYGYYFDNKIELLDAENEWYYDKTTGILYFYAPGGVNPNSLQIEAVVLKYGLQANTNTHYLKVKDLKISGFKDNGIEFYGGNNKTITGCYINHTGTLGIRINGLNHIIEDNTFEDNLNTAITGVITGGSIKNNNVNRTGLIPGYGQSGSGYVALSLSNCQNLTIEYNNVDSSGYNGIGIAKNNLLKNNVIDYSCLTLNDGAGIDITNCDSLKIINNIVSNSIGNFETSGLSGSYSCGIYVNGALMTNTTIQGNTVSNCRYMGILIDHKNTPVNNKIIGNTCYNNFSAQMLFTDYSAVSFIPSYNTVVKNNILYSLNADQACLHLRGHTSGGISDYGLFDSNYYCNPYSDFVVRRTNFSPSFITNVYTLAGWKSNYNEDPNSKSLPFSFGQYAVTDTLSNNLITNSRFISNVSGWSTFPRPGSAIAQTTHPLLDTGCMRLRWNGVGYSESLTLSNGYPIVSGQTFLVSLSFVSTHSGTFNLWGRSSLNASLATFPQTFISFQNYRKEYSFTFKADTTDPAALISIGLKMPDSLVYVDNVNIFRVNVEKIDSTQKSKIFINKNNFASNISLNGISYKDLDGNPVTGSIVVQPYSSKILVNENFTPSSNLNLNAFIEGRFNSSINKMIPDTVTVYMRNASVPYTIVDSSKSLLDSNGNGNFSFTKTQNSINYYIVVKHRNSIETWSSSPASFTSDQLNFDFTASAGSAYGNNLKLMGTKYCIYSGDLDNNGEVSLVDINQIFNVVNDFSTGYVIEDITGNQIVDLVDLNIAVNNSSNFIVKKRP